MQAGLTRLGLGHSLATYAAGGPKDSFPGQGTIFVDGRGTTPVVYVEDRIVSEDSQGLTSTSYTASSYAESSSYNTSYTSPSYAMSSTSYSATPSTSYATTPSDADPSTSYSTSYASPVGEWTEWEWNAEYKCKVRRRDNPNVEGGYEWDYLQVESSDKGKSSGKGIHRRR